MAEKVRNEAHESEREMNKAVERQLRKSQKGSEKEILMKRVIAEMNENNVLITLEGE